MKRTIHGMVMMTLLAGVCSGCQTFGNGAAGTATVGMAPAGYATLGTSMAESRTVRGQSPEGAVPEWAQADQAQASQAQATENGVVPAGHYHTPIRSAASEIQDHYVEHHSKTIYHGTVPQEAGGAPGCPPGGYSGYENCPPGNAHGLGTHGCRQDRYSYNYLVPNNLVYPQQNSVGGAVVYPYYTHRGPSDFFRQ
ncbi:MAG TPA: hypothetical protein VNQ76_09060 [Planctomicrobium sp.]|nr:hypothetical protein [Planctomicrobium sp.]